MTARRTSENLKQLEQLTFDAGVKFAFKMIRMSAAQTTKNEIAEIILEPNDSEFGLEEFRQLAIVRSLESQVMNDG